MPCPVSHQHSSVVPRRCLGINGRLAWSLALFHRSRSPPPHRGVVPRIHRLLIGFQSTSVFARFQVSRWHLAACLALARFVRTSGSSVLRLGQIPHPGSCAHKLACALPACRSCPANHNLVDSAIPVKSRLDLYTRESRPRFACPGSFQHQNHGTPS